MSIESKMYLDAEQFESIARASGFHDFDVMGNGCYADDFLQHFYLGWQASRQAPVAAKAAQPTPVNKGAHPERPSTAEIMSVLASHYGVDTGVVALWILEFKVQEAA